jgi:uncharacterized membrane protein
MKPKTIGIILIAAGALMMLYTGFNYVTTEKVVDLGPVQINREKQHSVKWPSILGGVIILGGIMILTLSKKSND